jgi:hypothetical protein
MRSKASAARERQDGRQGLRPRLNQFLGDLFMDKNMIIASLTGFLGCIRNIFKALSEKKKSPGNNNPPTGGTGNGSVNANGGIVVINQNITNNYYFISYEEASKKFSIGTEKILIAEDKESGADILMELKQRSPEYLAIGFYAYCSFGDKKDLPVWMGFQPNYPPKKDNTLNDLTFSIELLNRKAWRKAGIERAQLDACGYEEEGKENDSEDAHYKFFDKIKLDADAKILRECFESELKSIGEMLS